MLIARISYCFILLLFPFYLFPSGGIQISTGVLLATFICFLIAGFRHISIGKAVYTHALFILYAASVNMAWYLLTDNAEFLVYLAYLVVTAIMYFCSVMMGRSMSSTDAHLIIVLLFASVVAQLVFVTMGLGGELTARQTAFFNNPNQLAYYVAACCAIVLLLSHIFKLKSILVLLTCVVALVVAAFTASRGGVAACLIYVFLAIFGSSSLKGWGKPMAMIVLFVVVLLSFERFMSTPTFEALNERVEATGEVDEAAEGRGYDRILIYTDKLIWGFGEGAFERFDSDIELHSYFGTLLFSYGVIGSVLFLWFLRSAVPGWRSFTFLIPLFIYNLTHNGGRSLMFWAVLGLMAAATLPAIGHGRVTRNSPSRVRKSRQKSPKISTTVTKPDIDLSEVDIGL